MLVLVYEEGEQSKSYTRPVEHTVLVAGGDFLSVTRQEIIKMILKKV